MTNAPAPTPRQTAAVPALPPRRSPRLADAVATLIALFGAPLEARDVEALRQPLPYGALAPLVAVGDLADEAEVLLTALRGLGETEAAVGTLSRAFCLLFLGAGGPTAAPPYESAYQGSGRLFQKPAAEMAEMLDRWDRRPAEDFPEAPDHLVIELALLEEALLRADQESTDPECVGGETLATATIAVLVARLRRWVPDFAAACRAGDPTGFYTAAAGLLDRLLAQDFIGHTPLPIPH